MGPVVITRQADPDVVIETIEWSAVAATETSELRALPLVVATVQRRHPTASIALVERCVYDAVQAFRDARVRQYLLILIERWASDAVRAAVTRADEAPREIRGSAVLT
jgi:hypothetical protein